MDQLKQYKNSMKNTILVIALSLLTLSCSDPEVPSPEGINEAKAKELAIREIASIYPGVSLQSSDWRTARDGDRLIVFFRLDPDTLGEGPVAEVNLKTGKVEEVEIR